MNEDGGHSALQGTKQLRQEIDAAFGAVEYPGDDNIVCDNTGDHLENNEIKALFAGRHWREVPLATALRHPEALSSFTLDAFRFFLPAFLLAALLHYDKADILPEYIVSTFKEPSHPYDRERHSNRLRVLTSDQKRAIQGFLEFLEQEHAQGFLPGELESARLSLASGPREQRQGS